MHARIAIVKAQVIAMQATAKPSFCASPHFQALAHRQDGLILVSSASIM
jgi:hypothetical protein